MWLTGAGLTGAGLSAGSAGCAPAAKEGTLQRLTKRVAELSREVGRQRQALDELASQVVVLQDRVDDNRVRLSRRAAPAGAASPRPARARPPARRAAPGAKARHAAKQHRRRLPVVKVRKDRPAPRRPGGARGGRGSADGKSIRLTLHGKRRSAGRSARSGRGGRGGRQGRARQPLPQVGERLPVVPLADARDAPAADPSARPEVAYRQARALYRKRDYDAAAKAFSRIAKAHPKHSLADNALYWRADCAYRKGRYRRAAWVLRRLLKRYPSGNKAPSALLKLGLCEERLGRKAKARKVLSQLLQLYPGSREAKLAAARLEKLR